MAEGRGEVVVVAVVTEMGENQDAVVGKHEEARQGRGVMAVLSSGSACTAVVGGCD